MSVLGNGSPCPREHCRGRLGLDSEADGPPRLVCYLCMRPVLSDIEEAQTRAYLDLVQAEGIRATVARRRSA